MNIDFLILGCFLAVAAISLAFAIKKGPRNRRLMFAVLAAFFFFMAWAELAVGVFTKLGS